MSDRLAVAQLKRQGKNATGCCELYQAGKYFACQALLALPAMKV